MPYRTTPFANDHFYHVFNRGVEKRIVFLEDKDYQRFLNTFYYYQFSGPKPRFSTYKRFRGVEFNKKPKIVDILCYCLMPNHFHLLLSQLKEGGIQEFISKILNSYTKYFNIKYKRIGSLFQGQFKAVLIESDEQLIHLSRYIHLNPFVGKVTKGWENFPYSSYREFSQQTESPLCNTKYILDFFDDLKNYRDFINDHKDYAMKLDQFKHLLLEE